MTTMNEFSRHDAVTIERIVTEAHAFRAAVIAGAFTGLSRKIAQGVAKVVTAQKRRATTAQLLAMDDRMLRDIGLTRSEVPLVVCGLASGESPNVFANAQSASPANLANENSRSRAA
jgi:uncharacterized protein YjiS (DUF1127 family)